MVWDELMKMSLKANDYCLRN